jgi:hypothetical protein
MFDQFADQIAWQRGEFAKAFRRRQPRTSADEKT